MLYIYIYIYIHIVEICRPRTARSKQLAVKGRGWISFVHHVNSYKSAVEADSSTTHVPDEENRSKSAYCVAAHGREFCKPGLRHVSARLLRKFCGESRRFAETVMFPCRTTSKYCGDLWRQRIRGLHLGQDKPTYT